MATPNLYTCMLDRQFSVTVYISSIPEQDLENVKGLPINDPEKYHPSNMILYA